MVRAASVAFAACALLAACGDDASGAMDDAGDAGIGGGDAGAPIAIAPPAPPAAPMPPRPAALPVLTPCPDGFVTLEDADGPATCEPWPEDLEPASCADGEVLLPGTTGCAPIGGACAEDGWPAALPATGVLFVSSGAPAGGDGSRAAPLPAIADALALATGGTTIALARGDYAESFSIPAGVTVRGACTGETRITPPASTDVAAPAVTFAGAGARLEDVTIASDRPGIRVDGDGATANVARVEVIDGRGPAINVLPGTTLSVDRVSIRRIARLVPDGVGFGVFADTATVYARRLSVLAVEGPAMAVQGNGASATLRDVTFADAARSDGLGLGLFVHAGAVARVSRATIRRVNSIGVLLGAEGTAITIEDTTIRDTTEDVSGQFGRGIEVELGARATVRRTLLAGNREASIGADQATIDLEDVVVRDSRARSDGGVGRAISMGAGSLTTRRVLVERAYETGVLVSREAVLDGSDLVIRDVLPQMSDGGRGVGLEIAPRTTATVARVEIEGAHLAGVYIAGATAALSDVAISRTRFSSDVSTAAFAAWAGAQVRVERMSVDDAEAVGIFVYDPGTALQAVDVAISDLVPLTASGPGMGIGRGVEVNSGASIALERASIERYADVAIAIGQPGTTARLYDVAIAEGIGRQDGNVGRGIGVGDGATVEGARVRIDGAREAGIVVATASAHLTDVEVVGTRSIPIGLYGHGLAVQFGGTAHVERVVLSGNREVAASAFEGSTLTLRDARLVDTEERVCPVPECEPFPAGIGLAVRGSVADLERFEIARNALIGIQLTGGATLVAARGTIADHPVGVNVQDVTFDPTMFQNDVRFERNEQDFDVGVLPVPSL